MSPIPFSKAGAKYNFFQDENILFIFYYNLSTPFSICSHPCTHLPDNTRQIYEIIITLNFQCIKQKDAVNYF